jgi:phosphatidate cytidylyltransferase
MKNRLIGGAVIAAIMIPILFIGGYVFDVAMLILSAIAYMELLELDKKDKTPNIMKVVGFVGITVLAFARITFGVFTYNLSFSLLSILLLVMLIPSIFLSTKGYGAKDAFNLSIKVIFLGIAFNEMIMLFTENRMLFIYVLLVSMMTDIFALFGGKLIGKHKFTKISPNKTIEGCISGLVFATIVGTFFYATFFNYSNIALIIGITMFLSVIGQIGDLFFSLIKREYDIKDFSNLIPGHGGILDRLDNLIFTVMIFSFIIKIL